MLHLFDKKYCKNRNIVKLFVLQKKKKLSDPQILI